MTPKDKAKELVVKYYDLDQHNKTSIKYCKQCALIAVNQVLESIPPLITLEGFGSALFENDDCIWWQEVKQELEKI